MHETFSDPALMDNADSTADLNPSDPTLHLVQQRLLNRITHRIRQSLDLDAILTATVAEVQAFLKTDRVKIYQFQPDDHGLVIAEALAGDRLPSLRGLHFPADDIPAGARELYLRARQRTVVDLEAQKIGISDYPSLADTAAATTAELRYRPVDPCHVEYLRAMGVQSSVVVPIVTAGNPRQPLPSLGQEALLWGLLVSHHGEPRVVTEAELALIQAVVDQLTIAITQAELLKMAQQREQQAVKLNRVTQLLHQTAEVNLEAALAEVVRIFDGIGGRLYLSDRPAPSPWQNTQTLPRRIYTHGVQPEPLPGRGDRPIEENLIWQHYLTAMSVDWETKAAPADRVQMPWSVEWMRSNYGFTAIPQDSTDAADIDANGWATVDVYQEPLLRTLTPAIEATPIRGLLILPLQLGRAVVGCLTLFRASRSEEILWAGMCQPDQRQMAPRQSFEAWRQLKQGQAAPWTQAELTLGQAIAERFSAAAQQHHLYSQVQALNAHLEQQIQARTAELDKTLHLAQQQQTLASILGQLQRAWDIDTIFRTATQEVRQLLKVDRVAVYRFDEDWGGSFIRDFEAVSPVWSNLILATRATWNDDYLQAHQGGRYRHQEVSVVSDIHQAQLSPCHIEVLESYHVRAFVVVPLFVGQTLWGLLGVYQHAQARQWAETDITFITQVATHLGAALQQADLLAIAQHKANRLPVMEEQQQTLAQVIAKIRASMDITQIFTTAVQEVRRLLHCDRVAILEFTPEPFTGVGTFVSVDGLPGDPTLLGETVLMPHWGEADAANGDAGVEAVADVAIAPLDRPWAQWLQQYQVQAYVVLPLRQQETLWGLLCLHQCQDRRQWQDWELDFLQQIANQLSVALTQSNLLEKAQAAKHLADAANRAKSEFLANMSHELRTPLNAILGLAESLQENIYGDLADRQRQAIATMERSGRHLLDLITDILDLARIEAGRLVLQPATISLHDLCEDTLRIVRPLAANKQLSLGIQLLPPITPQTLVQLDPLRVRQLLINLLNNGVKFTPSGGQVTLTVEMDPTAGQVTFAVEDTGIGIAPEDMPKLFQAFVQIDSRLNRQYEGTGLGLALVKHLVDAQHGHISVTSTPGEGSCFTVTLPYRGPEGDRGADAPAQFTAPKAVEAVAHGAASAATAAISPVTAHQPPSTPSHPETSAIAPMSPPVPETAPQPKGAIAPMPPPAVAPQKTATILLAEDTPTNVVTLMDYLDYLGYRLLFAEDGLAAVKIAAAQQPDLILMDIQMPRKNGLEAIAEIRQIPALQHVPIVALTALAMPGDEVRCLRVGVDAYLTKPVHLKTLGATIARLLTTPPYPDAPSDDRMLE